MTPSARRPPAVTRQRRSTAEVRALILSVAEEVFARRGYADASTVEIARLAGVERSVLYRHFGSKTGLFREAIAAPFLRFIESWSPPPIDRLPADLPDALLMRHFVAGLFEQLMAHRQAMVLLLYRSDELDPELREHVVRTIREGLDSLSEPIRANMTARQFPAEHADLAVRTVVSMVVGLVALPPDIFSAAPAGEELVLSYSSAMIMHGLALRPPEARAGKQR